MLARRARSCLGTRTARVRPRRPDRGGLRLARAELVEQAVELVERAEADRDLALFTARGLALDADLDIGGELVRQRFFQACDVARLVLLDPQQRALAAAHAGTGNQLLGFAHRELLRRDLVGG